jgi:hypothetical protein
MSLRKLAALLAMLSVVLATALPQPAAARPDEQDIRRALAALAVLGIIAEARPGHGRDTDRYGEPLSPAEGVVCLPRLRQCFRDGRLAYRRTQRIYGA